MTKLFGFHSSKLACCVARKAVCFIHCYQLYLSFNQYNLERQNQSYSYRYSHPCPIAFSAAAFLSSPGVKLPHLLEVWTNRLPPCIRICLDVYFLCVFIFMYIRLYVHICIECLLFDAMDVAGFGV